MKSIRRQLTVSLLGALSVMVLAGGAASYLLVRLYLIRQCDAALKSKAHALAALTTVTPAGLDFDVLEPCLCQR